MSIREEQCNKVCRILDDVLANRPTERDSLIVAVRKAFEALELFGNSEQLPSAQPDPEWIPCSERLPEKTALVTVETKTFRYRYICEAVWIPRWTWKASFDNWEDCSEYNEDEDEFYVSEGWYERVHNWDEYSYIGIEDDVIAWMPLPKPYKEGEQDD